MNSSDKRAISLEEAQSIVAGTIGVLSAEVVPLERALGRIIRQDVAGDVDYPPSDMSAMDGYCLASSGTRDATTAEPVLLKIAGKLRAGQVVGIRVSSGECISIMTGGTLPEGTDTVLKVEDVQRRGDCIVVTGPVRPGQFVRKQGEVTRAGETVGTSGRRATPALLGLLAALGAHHVTVASRPRVGILATGDELVPPDRDPPRGCLRCSNLPMLVGLASEVGCEVVYAGICGDSEADIIRGVDRCGKCDAIVMSGGVSYGEYDLVPGALAKAGARMKFRELRISPGKRMVFAKKAETAFFCLPGNPVAAAVSFYMIVKPGLLGMMGAAVVLPKPLRARISSEIRKDVGYRKLVPARLRRAEPQAQGPKPTGAEFCGSDTCPVVQPIASRSSGDLLSLAEADCLASLDAAVECIHAGDVVDVFMLSSPAGSP